MIVNIQECQDIVYSITREELSSLKFPTRDYHSNSIRNSSRRLDNSFFLGHSKEDSFFREVTTENGLQIILPKIKGDPYYVNLTDEAVTQLEQGKEVSTRISGGTKLLIILKGTK